MKKWNIERIKYILDEYNNLGNWKSTYESLLKKKYIKNKSYGSFKQHINILLKQNIKNFNKVFLDNRIILEIIEWDKDMSKKTKTNKKITVNDKEWEDMVNGILDKYDKETLKKIVIEQWKENINEIKKIPKQKAISLKVKSINYLNEKTALKIIDLIKIYCLAHRTFYFKKDNTIDRKVREDNLIYDPSIIRLVLDSYESSKRIYGAYRISIDILRKHNIKISESSVQRIMNNNCLQATFTKNKKLFRESKNTKFECNNLINDQLLENSKPNELVSADFSVLKINNNYYHLYTMIDIVTSKVLYWELNDYQKSDVVLRGLKMNPNIKVFHSDHGSQFIESNVRSYLDKNNIKQSMGKVGKSTDNRPAEFFFNMIKNEWLVPIKYFNKSFNQVKHEIDWYVNFYNYQRISTKFDMTPFELESMLK